MGWLGLAAIGATALLALLHLISPTDWVSYALPAIPPSLVLLFVGAYPPEGTLPEVARRVCFYAGATLVLAGEFGCLGAFHKLLHDTWGVVGILAVFIGLLFMFAGYDRAGNDGYDPPSIWSVLGLRRRR